MVTAVGTVEGAERCVRVAGWEVVGCSAGKGDTTGVYTEEVEDRDIADGDSLSIDIAADDVDAAAVGNGTRCGADSDVKVDEGPYEGPAECCS